MLGLYNSNYNNIIELGVILYKIKLYNENNIKKYNIIVRRDVIEYYIISVLYYKIKERLYYKR